MKSHSYSNITNKGVLSQWHYATFGSRISTRSYSSGAYRYGFNSMEKDPESFNDAYDFGARIYDGRIGRWLSLDPLMRKYPYVSGYIGMGNNPILFIDADGREIKPNNKGVLYEGPEVPSCLGEVAKTEFTLDFTMGETGKVDIVFNYLELRSSSFVELLKLNYGLNEYVDKHEAEHKKRSLIVVQENYNYKYKEVDYIGTIDVICTKILSDNYSKKLTEITNLYNEGMAQCEATRAINEAAGMDYDLMQKIYKEARNKVKGIKEKSIEELKTEQDKIFKEISKEITIIVEGKSKLANIHKGSEGVSAVSETTMSQSAKNLSTGETSVVNQNNEELTNCPGED